MAPRDSNWRGVADRSDTLGSGRLIGEGGARAHADEDALSGGSRHRRAVRGLGGPVGVRVERVLLVDDDVEVLDALTLHLGTQYEIITCHAGAKGVAILQRQPVDLVILEYRLPDLSGLQLLAQFKATRPRLPVIMVTAYGSEWVCASALKLGARDYFIKPFDPADLVASIRFILSTRSRQKEGRKNVLAVNKDVGELLSYQPTSQPVTSDGNELAVHKAARFIQERYWESISLPQVARLVGISRFVLSRKFKVVMKVPFRKYLLQLRVMKAKELLQMSQHSITEVAQMVGFGDLPRFDKVFKYFIGESPSEYRASVHTEAEQH